MFLLFKNVFRNYQYAFGIVEESSNFLLNLFVYLYLASTIMFGHLFHLAGKRFLFSSVWLEQYLFGKFRTISQRWNNLSIHPVGILMVDFDNLIRNKIFKYISYDVVETFNFFISCFVTKDVILIH